MNDLYIITSANYSLKKLEKCNILKTVLDSIANFVNSYGFKYYTATGCN